MRLNGDNTSKQERLDRAMYLAARLRRAKFDDLLAIILGARENYLTQVRAEEDAHGPVVLAIADRNAVDEELDDLVKGAAATLRGRSPTAAVERPYSDLVPKGVDAITLANLEDTPGEYLGLVGRAQKFLPEGDAVRVQLESGVPPLVGQFIQAREAVKAAMRAEVNVRLDREGAEDALDRVVEKIAGALIERVGKRAADRFFWKQPKAAKKPE